MIDYDNKILKQAYAFPDEDEMEVAKFLVDGGAKLILFLTPNLAPNTDTPDMLVDRKIKWEIKTPDRSTDRALQRAFRVALHQSENVIFYIKNLKISEENTTRTLKRLFAQLKSARRLKIITRSGRIIDFIK